MTRVITEYALRRIVEYGAKAPSGDNCQPWIFRRNGQGLDLLNDAKRSEHFMNVRQAPSWIAHGAALENMAIAAKSMGYAMACELFPRGEDDPLVATVSFRETQEEASPLLSFLSTRCTNRRPYRREKLRPMARQALMAAGRESPESGLYLIEEEPLKDRLAGILVLNERMIFESRGYHDSLFKEIRWSRQEAESTRDGLYIKTLELGALKSRLFQTLKSWPLVESLNLLGLSRFMPRMTYPLYRRSAAIGLIQVPAFSAKAFVLGGRLVQRVWLTAAAQGLAFQILFGVPGMILKLRHDGGRGLSETHKRLIAEAEAELKEIAPLEGDRVILALFRVGYAPAPSALSLRRRVDIL